MSQTINEIEWVEGSSGIDKVTSALEVIDYAHHEAHAGNHFFVRTWLDIEGAGTTAYLMFRTPNTTTRVHAKALIEAEAEFLVEIYEGGTVSADGTPVVANNNDRDKQNTHVAELTAFSAPTVTADGTLLWATRVGSGRGDTGVSPGLGYEIIAATNQLYLFKITKAATSTHYINFDFFWYEHLPEN